MKDNYGLAFHAMVPVFGVTIIYNYSRNKFE